MKLFRRQYDTHDETSRLINVWLANPGTYNYDQCDLPAVLRVVDQQLIDAWEHDHDTDRQNLLRLKEALLEHQEMQLQKAEAELEKEPIRKTEAGVPCFRTLSQAVSFIVGVLEQNSAATLSAACARLSRPELAETYLLDRFNDLFAQLKARHQAIDFREIYRGRRFPESVNQFTMGGHFSELGCIHIEFRKLECGWVLDEIFECR